MSINWGPAVDAEIAYRHQQIRSDFHRPWRRRAGRAVKGLNQPPAVPVDTVDHTTEAAVATTIPAVELPVQPVRGSRVAASGEQPAKQDQHVRAA